jgi:hypothetical protein
VSDLLSFFLREKSTLTPLGNDAVKVAVATLILVGDYVATYLYS